jgi:hypothetical protein
MLKGEAKTAYQREYMRRKRAGLPTAKPKSTEPSRASGGILGIKPWLERGGFALYRGGQWALADMPTKVVKGKRKRQLDKRALLALVGQLKPECAFLESDSQQPGGGHRQGGCVCCAVEMALIVNNVPYKEVARLVWKKDVSPTRAEGLFKAAGFNPGPGKRDAMLIAHYGSQIVQRR